MMRSGAVVVHGMQGAMADEDRRGGARCRGGHGGGSGEVGVQEEDGGRGEMEELCAGGGEELGGIGE
ncbi:hypothetical protein ACHAWX_000018, partial [Stephanocyclus meneghinianus]